jgi:hypothetical protein
MLFADWFAESFGQFVLVMALGLFVIGRFLGKFDSDGVLKVTTKKGLASVISRWLK